MRRRLVLGNTTSSNVHVHYNLYSSPVRFKFDMLVKIKILPDLLFQEERNFGHTNLRDINTLVPTFQEWRSAADPSGVRSTTEPMPPDAEREQELGPHSWTLVATDCSFDSPIRETVTDCESSNSIFRSMCVQYLQLSTTQNNL